MLNILKNIVSLLYTVVSETICTRTSYLIIVLQFLVIKIYTCDPNILVLYNILNHIIINYCIIGKTYEINVNILFGKCYTVEHFLHKCNHCLENIGCNRVYGLAAFCKRRY